ncbi:hypothetical protein M9H77_11799 [Catharanthus roseus]|uniref:Uncharacterized protein n=1 Tax=Catharanthus roseus TaxID=4058 RepID=A0ACC0BFJ0_CATRO|nr:hypothetical protein M9H77_11799 [Catharanthus roseus]
MEKGVNRVTLRFHWPSPLSCALIKNHSTLTPATYCFAYKFGDPYTGSPSSQPKKSSKWPMDRNLILKKRVGQKFL